MRASDEKWQQFGDELTKRQAKANEIITNKNIPFEKRYNKWYGELDSAARNTIGKTTFKAGGKEKFSNEFKELQGDKKELRTEIKAETDPAKRGELIERYKVVKDKTTAQITHEREEINRSKFDKIIADRSRKTFWNEKKKLSRDPVLESLTIKDQNGQRQYHPEAVKEHTARYYESLYTSKPFPYQPYHHMVQQNIQKYLEDMSHEHLPHNWSPTYEEVIEAIQNKSNGKSTTDI